MEKYNIKYLPLFYKDLNKITDYIIKKLNNEIAANNLLDEIEKEIKNRSLNPESFEEYYSSKKRKNKYYRIYINNYIVFYTVYNKDIEIRRILYNKMNYKKIL